MKLELTDVAENIVKQAAFSCGPDANFNQLQEECAELIVAVSHFRRDRIGWSELVEEIADVYLMIQVINEYLKLMSLDGLVYNKVIDKAYKLRERAGLDRVQSFNRVEEESGNRGG